MTIGICLQAGWIPSAIFIHKGSPQVGQKLSHEGATGQLLQPAPGTTGPLGTVPGHWLNSFIVAVMSSDTTNVLLAESLHLKALISKLQLVLLKDK